MVITKKGDSAPHGSARSRRDARAAAARCHGARRLRARRPPSRRRGLSIVYVPNGIMMDKWTPDDRRRRLRADADPGAAGAVPGSHARADRARPQPRRPRPAGRESRRPCPRRRPYLTGVHPKKTEGADTPRRHLGGPDRRAGVRQETRSSRRSSSASRSPELVGAAKPATPAPTSTPSPGARRRRRCRWRTVRASSSSGCSATPRAPIRSAPAPDPAGPQHSRLPSPKKANALQGRARRDRSRKIDRVSRAVRDVERRIQTGRGAGATASCRRSSGRSASRTPSPSTPS